MRSDMFKVIVERPRWASRHAPAVKLKKDRNADRKFVGHKRHAWEEAAYTKCLNENLAPLKRFLQKQRGRRWDDVYSEICQHLDTGSTVKMHVREHVDDFIMVRISTDRDGVWLGQGRWGSPWPVSRWWPDLYVDPNDGIIKETRILCDKLGVEKKRSNAYSYDSFPKEPFEDFKRLSAEDYLIRRNGLWFCCNLDQEPSCSKAQLRHEIIEGAWREHEEWKVLKMKQLSKKELKHHELSNCGGVHQ